MGQLSNYPPGVTGMEPQINGYPETTNDGVCPDCGLKFNGLTFVWLDDEEGMSECPECEAEIWIQAPEPDYESIAEAKAEMARDRYLDRGYY